MKKQTFTSVGESDETQDLQGAFFVAVGKAGGRLFRIKQYPVSDALVLPGRPQLPTVMAFQKESVMIIGKKLDFETKSGYVSVNGLDIPLVNQDGFKPTTIFWNEEDCDNTIKQFTDISIDAAKAYLEEASLVVGYLEQVKAKELF